MHEPWQDWLPFYVTGQLPPNERRAVAQHLDACPACRIVLQEWQAVAAGVQGLTAARATGLPPLAPVVLAQVRPRPRLGQALAAAMSLVWAQRVLLMHTRIGPAGLVLLALGAVLVSGLPDRGLLLWLLLVPILAGLSGVALYSPQADPAFELVATTPIPPPTLVFARLTCLLGAVGSVALLGSVPVSRLTGVTLSGVVAAWLGPALLLAALATLLALLWRPLAAAAVTLGLWIGVISLLQAELGGQPLLPWSLRGLLQPSGGLLAAQLGTALALWAVSWWVLTRTNVLTQHWEH